MIDNKDGTVLIDKIEYDVLKKNYTKYDLVSNIAWPIILISYSCFGAYTALWMYGYWYGFCSY